MHQLRFSTALAGLVAAWGLVIIAPAARAATGGTTGTGATCQPVLSGSNPNITFKATGIRNESTTTGSFVICPLPSTLGSGSYFTDTWINLYSIDGASHDVTCTAVAGELTNFMQYSSKTVTFTGANQGQLEWTAADFGSFEGDAIPDGYAFSVTCALPPQTMVRSIHGAFVYYD